MNSSKDRIAPPNKKQKNNTSAQSTTNSLNQGNVINTFQWYDAANNHLLFLPSYDLNEKKPVKHQIEKQISGATSSNMLTVENQGSVEYCQPNASILKQPKEATKKTDQKTAAIAKDQPKKPKKTTEEIMTKNREGARAFRERQKEKVNTLEEKINCLVEEEDLLKAEIEKMKIANLSLIQQRDHYRNILTHSTIFYKKEGTDKPVVLDQTKPSNSTGFTNAFSGKK